MYSSSKRKSRLSLTKKMHKDKTGSPIISSSPQNIPCSPSPSATRILTENCSTPVTSKKRSYFLEESPSQDFDVPLSQQMPIPLSQDTLNLHGTVDVGWKWQSPKATTSYSMNLPKSKFVRDKHERIIIKSVPDRPQYPGKAEIKGFFKFQEELQKLTDKRPSTPEEAFSDVSEEQTKPDLEINIEQLLDSLNDGQPTQTTKSNLCDIKTSDSPEKSDELTIMPQQLLAIRQSDSDKENKCLAELLDDSDFVLMKCSQEIDKMVNEHQKPSSFASKPALLNPIKITSYLPTHLNTKTPSDEQFDDSFDDFLSSIPLDDIISSQDTGATLHEKMMNKQFNKNLTRHRSMPLENNRVSYQVGFAVSKQRMSAKKKLDGVMSFDDYGWNSSTLSKTSNSSSSSTSSSGISTYKKCNSYEIEMKRHEALQKLEARRKAALMSKK